MTTFKDFVADLARDEVTITPAEVAEMRAHFGDKVLQMGHLQPDGSINVPVDCVVSAARSLGKRDTQIEFSDAFVASVAESRRQKLEAMVDRLQSEANDTEAHRQWKAIEKLVFGVDYKD